MSKSNAVTAMAIAFILQTLLYAFAPVEQGTIFGVIAIAAILFVFSFFITFLFR